MTEYMNLSQLRIYSGRSRSWLMKRIRSKELKAVKFEPRGPWMIKREWFDEFIAEHANALEMAEARLNSSLKAKSDSFWERIREAS